MRVIEAGPVLRGSGSGRDNCSSSSGASGASDSPEECDQDDTRYMTNHITEMVFQSAAVRKR